MNMDEVYNKLGYKNRMDYIVSMSKIMNSCLEKDIKRCDNDKFDKFMLFLSTNEEFQIIPLSKILK